MSKNALREITIDDQIAWVETRLKCLKEAMEINRKMGMSGLYEEKEGQIAASIVATLRELKAGILPENPDFNRKVNGQEYINAV